MNVFAQTNKTFLEDEYVNKKKSTYEIAKALKTNSKKIQRALISLGVKLRSHSEAQAVALERGVSKHPTKGKKASASTKNKMSRAVSKYWSKMSDAEKQRRTDMSKAQWEAMSDADRRELFAKAAAGCRKAATEGSALEKFIRKGLTERGYLVRYHEKRLVRDTNLEIDLYLPDLNMVIEIDGISHFEPIWGEDVLKKQQKADDIKAGLILSLGYVMVRVKQICKTASLAKKNDTLDAILKMIDGVKDKFPEEGKRFIELEIK